jgi:hypothetical protein
VASCGAKISGARVVRCDEDEEVQTMIHVIVIVTGVSIGLWLEGWSERRAHARERIKARLPRRVG